MFSKLLNCEKGSLVKGRVHCDNKSVMCLVKKPKFHEQPNLLMSAIFNSWYSGRRSDWDKESLYSREPWRYTDKISNSLKVQAFLGLGNVEQEEMWWCYKNDIEATSKDRLRQGGDWWSMLVALSNRKDFKCKLS